MHSGVSLLAVKNSSFFHYLQTKKSYFSGLLPCANADFRAKAHDRHFNKEYKCQHLTSGTNIKHYFTTATSNGTKCRSSFAFIWGKIQMDGSSQTEIFAIEIRNPSYTLK